MVNFIFKTQQDELTTFDGPSGERYTINQGMSFKVGNEKDIEFFRNNLRFQEQGIIKKAEGIIKEIIKKPEPKPDVDELLSKELDKVKGLTKKTKDRVVELYFSLEHLTDQIEQNYPLDPSLSLKQKKLLKEHILKIKEKKVN